MTIINKENSREIDRCNFIWLEMMLRRHRADPDIGYRVISPSVGADRVGEGISGRLWMKCETRRDPDPTIHC